MDCDRGFAFPAVKGWRDIGTVWFWKRIQFYTLHDHPENPTDMLCSAQMIVVTRLATKRAEAQVEAYARKFDGLDDLNIEVIGLYPERVGASLRFSRDSFDETRTVYSEAFCGAFDSDLSLEPSATAAINAIVNLLSCYSSVHAS